MNDTMNAFAAKAVTVALSQPIAGIEDVQRQAVLGQDGLWHVVDLLIPQPGRWHIRADVLVNDFE